MLKSINLGKIKLKNRIFLAPMHEVNDIAFRVLCKKAGAGLTYTGLINPQTREKLFFNDKPAVQFACNDTKGIKEFIKRNDEKISLYDFNLGCPSPHAKQSKIGYFMIQDYQKIEKILKEIKRYTKKPLTIKVRKMPEEIARKILLIAERYCVAIAVHPRTQEQGYAGIPDLEFARFVRKNTCLPVIYSGNIQSREEAENMLKEFDLIMIGRAAIGNPSIFTDLNNEKVKKRIDFFDWLKLAKKIDKKIYFSQIKFQAISFTRGFNGASKIRAKLSVAKDEREVLSIMKENL